MRTLAHETVVAARSLLKRPGLTLLVVVTLALGLGANAAIFGVIDALVLRPFPAAETERLAVLAETSPGAAFRQFTVAPANFLDWKRQSDVFEHLSAIDWWDVNLVGRDEPERVQGFFVSADFFATMGVEPALGRGFAPEEETFGRHHRVVLSQELWRRRFDADPAVLGRPVLVDGTAHEVVGVAPAGFSFPSGSEIWAPLAFDPAEPVSRTIRNLTVVGRLAPGRTLEDAQAQMTVVADRLAREHPRENRDRGVRVYTLAQGMMDVGLGPMLSLWQAAAGFVLLIACANIANLLLARGAERQREVALRLALGAGRWRVVRGLLVESALLGAAAIPAALLVASISLDLVRVNLPARLIRFVAGWQDMDVDGRVLAFTALLALVTAVGSGLLPALQASRPRLAETLKEGGRTTTGRRGRLRQALVVAEMALALPLLVAAGLAVGGISRFLNGPQGYEPDNLLVMRMVLSDPRYEEEAPRRRLVERALARLQALPGVEQAAAVNVIPGTGQNSSPRFEIEGQPAADPVDAPTVDSRLVTPQYFATLRIPILEGRGFTAADREDSLPVALVSRAMAQRYFPDGALGRRLRIGDAEAWATVVGVTGDHIHDWFGRRNHPTVFRPFAQSPTSYLALAVRTAGDPASLTAGARAAMRSVDPAQPVFDLMTMRALLEERTVGLQYIAAIMGVFAGLALLLATVGVYAVMAYVVTQRTHEIGVRMALGATRGDVERLAVWQAGRLTAVGVLVGLALSVALSRLMEAGMLGVVSSDPRLLAALAAVLVAASLAAGWVPARRAAALDPLDALRVE
ncbi:MAG TPA: ABC transporter permease [Thermoanaerobaculia bacterium]|nr:ABC transporter permease [Thermoanaerobaculia bacterium]